MGNTDSTTEATDKSTKQSILEEAQVLIHGARQQNYGSPKANLQTIAALWTAYINAVDATIDIVLNEQDVCAMMVMLKCARLNGTYHRDSVTDIAGYAGLMELVNDA